MGTVLRFPINTVWSYVLNSALIQMKVHMQNAQKSTWIRYQEFWASRIGCLLAHTFWWETTAVRNIVLVYFQIFVVGLWNRTATWEEYNPAFPSSSGTYNSDRDHLNFNIKTQGPYQYCLLWCNKYPEGIFILNTSLVYFWGPTDIYNTEIKFHNQSFSLQLISYKIPISKSIYWRTIN